MLVAVPAVHTLTVHQRHLVEQMTVEEFAIHLQSHIATVVNAIEGVAAPTRQIADGLRAHIDEFQLHRRQRVLHRERVLKLSHTYGECLIVGDTEVGIVLLYHTGEVVHEEERPTVGDASLHPNERALEVEVAGRPFVAHRIRSHIVMGIAALCITVDGDTAGQILQPVGLRRLLFLWRWRYGDGVDGLCCRRLCHRCLYRCGQQCPKLLHFLLQ